MEAALGSRRAMEAAQNAASLGQAFNASAQPPELQQRLVDYTLPNIQQINLTQAAKPFIESSPADFNQMPFQLGNQEQNRKQTTNIPMVAPGNEGAKTNNLNNTEQTAMQAPADDDVICISKNTNMIKKRSFEELQRRSQHESHGYGTSGSIDQCKSEQKSSRRKHRNKVAKSDFKLASNSRLKEESLNELEDQDDQHSIDRQSGSLHLRSAKSLRKKNMQMGKSTFSAQRKFEDEIIEVESAQK